MAVAFTSVNNAAGQNAGVTTPAATASITPTLPAGMVDNRSRVFVIQCHSGVAGTTPTDWNVLFKDTVVGSGAVAAGSGQRYMSVYYRDKTAAWSAMPAFTLTSATQLSHWIGAVAVTKDADTSDNTYGWATPTYSTPGSDFGTANTAHSAATGSLATHTNGFLIVGSAQNDNVTMTTPAMTQTGATFSTVTEVCDGGTATGNDIAGTVHVCLATYGGTGALTFTGTLSAASQGGTAVIEQTQTVTGVHYVAAAGAYATTYTTPNHEIGDLLMVTSTATSATPPTLGSGYTNVGTCINGSALASRIAYRVATGTDNTSDPSGTWTGSIITQVLIYRNAGAPGVHASNTGTSASVDYPAATLTTSNPWVLRYGTSNAATNLNSAAITGYTVRFGDPSLANWDSNGKVGSNPTLTSQAVNGSGAWTAQTVEIPAPAAAAKTYEYPSLAVHRASIY